MDTHSDKFAIGVELTVIHVNDRKNPQGLYTIIDYDHKHDMWKIRSKINQDNVCLIRKDGAGYYAMHSRESPHYYYSANPIHIKRVKASIKRISNKQHKKEKEKEKKINLVMPFTESYRDSEENYTFDFIPLDILDRLNIEQIKTFCSWLT